MKTKYTCPVCSGKNWKNKISVRSTHGASLAKSKKKFKYLECEICKCWYLVDIKFNKDFYSEFYSKVYYQKVSGLKASLERIFLEYRNWSRNKMILSLIRNKKRRVKILDIGAGDGNFIQSLDDNLFEKHAIDVESAKTHADITYYSGDFLKMKLPKTKFDVIVSWHVIEHIPNPKLFIRRASSLLNKSGVLVISTPSVDSSGFKTGKGNWFHFDAPRHVVLYSPEGLNKLQTQSLKLEKVFSEKIEFPLDLFWTKRKIGMKVIDYLLYPYLKFLSNETITAVYKKK